MLKLVWVILVTVVEIVVEVVVDELLYLINDDAPNLKDGHENRRSSLCVMYKIK